VLWVVSILTALLTAGYMTRLMVLTFHGENRSGADVRPHLREVPAVMWVPLAILAVLSVVGGWIQIPESLPALPAVDALHHWLEPVMEPARQVMTEHGLHQAHESPLGGGEAVWAIMSTALALIVVILTFRALVHRRYRPASESETPTGFAGILYNKWYVDELYDRPHRRHVERDGFRYPDGGMGGEPVPDGSRGRLHVLVRDRRGADSRPAPAVTIPASD